MSTRAMYRFFGDGPWGQEIHTVYKHHDGYPDGAIGTIKAALAFAWKLPRYEADEFAAAFVASAKQPSWIGYVLDAHDAKTDAERLTALEHVKRTRAYGTGGGVRLVAPVYTKTPDKLWQVASDIEYRYDVRFEGNELLIEGFSVSERDGIWTEHKLLGGTLKQWTRWLAREAAKAEKADA